MRIRKAMVTHEMDIDPLIKQEESWLESQLVDYWRTCPRNWHDKKRYSPSQRVQQRIVISKIMKGEQEDFVINKVIREYYGD